MDLKDTLLKELLYALNECFEGEGEDGGVFLEPEDPGLWSILDSLDSVEASKPVVGLSIANHIYHLAFAINVFIRRISGDEGACTVDWRTSWRERSLNEAEWQNLKEELASLLRQAICQARGQGLDGSSRYSRLVLGLLTHTVFHLGVVRVKFDELKSK